MRRKRTNRVGRFFSENRRLRLFLLLPIVGCVCGMLVYSLVQPAAWLRLFTVERLSPGFSGAFSEWLQSCFQPMVLLTLLFLTGLSVCGAPFAILVPVFWGLGLGMTQASYYASGWQGMLIVAAVVLPHSVMELVALLMAASESLRMSLRFTGLLLPRSAHCGGLWQEFRLYGIRFLLLLFLLFGAGALDVVMRLVFAGGL